MKESQFEEIVFLLSTIIAVLSFGYGFTLVGSVFTAKALFDFYCAVKIAIKEVWNEFK